MSEDLVFDFGLHPAQMQVFRCPARFISLAAGRRFGKSIFALKRGLYKALSPLNVQKKPVWIVAPTQPQAKQIYWQPLMNLASRLIVHQNSNEGVVTLLNGVQFGIKGADRPDSLRGVGLFDATLDEWATTKAETGEEIIRPALTDVRGTGLFIGTPKGRNHYYHLHDYALNSGDPEWAAFTFESTANPFLPEGEVEAARKNLSSSQFRQEYQASFETGGSDLFKPEWIKYGEEPRDDKGNLADGDFYVAVDLAGFADVARAQGYLQHRLDETAIATVKVLDDGSWWVKSITCGRWGIEETARRIVEAVEAVKAVRMGIEKGALFNAISSQLTAAAARKGIPMRPEALTHENRDKADRVTWALQGRFEHGKITLAPGDWNKKFVDQYTHFPSKLVHDDSIEALAYIEQLARGRVFEKFSFEHEAPEWEPMDATVGF